MVVVHITLNVLSTTLPAARFTIECNDWKQDIGPDTFKNIPKLEGGITNEVEHVKEGKQM